jgi:hypothetical protein
LTGQPKKKKAKAKKLHARRKTESLKRTDGSTRPEVVPGKSKEGKARGEQAPRRKIEVKYRRPVLFSVLQDARVDGDSKQLLEKEKRRQRKE